MHSFDPEIAARVGVNAAILYQNILWWCAKNAANEKHMHDGRYWTYNTAEAWARLFPYLTPKQIRGAIDKLKNDGLILVGEYNTSSYNRTKWYCPSGHIDFPKRENGLSQKGKSITDINTDIKKTSSLEEAKKDRIFPDFGPAPPDVEASEAEAPPLQPAPLLPGHLPTGRQAETASVRDTLCRWTSPAAADSFIAYRRRIKGKALTLTAARRLASTLKDIFQRGGDTDDALGLAEERGWLSIKADWYFRDRDDTDRGSDRPGAGLAAAAASVAAEEIARQASRQEARAHQADIDLDAPPF